MWTENTKFILQEGQLPVTSQFKSMWNGFLSTGVDQIWLEFCCLCLMDDFPKERETGGQGVITDAWIHPPENGLYNHCSLFSSRNQWVIVLKSKTTKDTIPNPKALQFLFWLSVAAKVCVTVSLWSCGDFGFSLGITENDIFLLILYPSDISSLSACNGFHYFWCCEA